MATERIANDILDQDYVLVGSFFDQLLSKETRVQEADADLRKLMRNGLTRRSPESRSTRALGISDLNSQDNQS